MLTGMEQLYPGVCSEGSNILTHTFPGDKCIYIGVGINSVLFNYKGESQDLNLGRAEVDTHVFCM